MYWDQKVQVHNISMQDKRSLQGMCGGQSTLADTLTGEGPSSPHCCVLTVGPDLDFFKGTYQYYLFLENYKIYSRRQPSSKYVPPVVSWKPHLHLQY